jgi:hypothetical protein
MNYKSKFCFTLITENRTYYLNHENKQEIYNWIDNIKKFIKELVEKKNNEILNKNISNNNNNSNNNLNNNNKKKRLSIFLGKYYYYYYYFI